MAITKVCINIFISFNRGGSKLSNDTKNTQALSPWGVMVMSLQINRKFHLLTILTSTD